ncbi:MAG TPA: glycosyltransferase family 39 protein [Xanthobacteraceae bacterium]|nr:glycosyltransferase family 39 protein [Xanthobacteraceae bacterium]
MVAAVRHVASAQMPYVSLIVEALRAQPAAVFWTAALAQACIWVVVPALFYTSPPGDLPELLAIGREWQIGSWRGPPLAFWLAELAFRAAGGRVIGVYILAQACIVLAFWAMFALGRAIVGVHHAAMAVLLMGGVLAFSAPTAEFGPAVLALPLTALSLLHFWRALGEGRRNAWIALAVILGLLLLTTYWGLLLVVLIAAFLILTREGRAALAGIDPWAATALTLLVPFPHLGWMWQSGVLRSIGAETTLAAGLAGRLAFWPVLLFGVLALHAGLIILAVLASGWRNDPQWQPPLIEGHVRRPLARKFIGFFALMLPVAGTLSAVVLNTGGTASWAGALVLMSALAVIVLAGERIAIHRQQVVGLTWVAILLVPPVALLAAIVAGPWTGAFELDSRQPAAAMGRFFTETFRRRLGKPLEIVVGDTREVYLVALSSPDRPRVFSAARPQRTPWLAASDVRANGAIVIWDVQDASGQPPPAIRARFPDLVAEIPQTFERPIQGLLPTLRIGWGVIRPSADAAQ